MKLFYFGSVCAQEVFNETVKNSKNPPSASAQSFETALIKGLGTIKDLKITSASAESIAMYPGSNRIFLTKRIDEIASGVKTNIVSAINLPLLKQYNHANGTAKLLKKWLKENKNETEKCVLSYGLYPAVAKKLQQLCKKYHCKCVCLITDIPKTMFTYTSTGNPLKNLFGNKYRENAVSLQGGFDGYIFLTEQMSEAVAPQKPFVVVETLADTEIFKSFKYTEKNNPPALMYAGALYKKYGVDLIIETFTKVKSDCELWLFGSGDYEEEIKRIAETDKRVKFFGRVSREEVLKAEKQATLLLNLRNGNDDYTKYSFPSKMVEYMLSGTPLLTTKLDGIPKEYYDFVYSVDNNDTEKTALLIDNILNNPKELCDMGEKAKSFVENNKNCFVQAEKINEFLGELCEGFAN